VLGDTLSNAVSRSKKNIKLATGVLLGSSRTKHVPDNKGHLSSDGLLNTSGGKRGTINC